MNADRLIQNLERRDRLSDEEKRVLAASLGPEREVRTGEEMVAEGDRPWQSTVLVEGFAARCKVRAGGRREIVSVHVPGDFVDLHSFLLKVMDHSVVALTPCKIAPVSHDSLQAISTDQPHLARLLWLSTVIDGSIFRQWLSLTGGEPTYRRTAHLICEILVRLQIVRQADQQRFAFPLAQADFGDVLGMSNADLIAALEQLHANRLITWRSGIITIEDWERLKEAAQFDPAYLNLRSEPR